MTPAAPRRTIRFRTLLAPAALAALFALTMRPAASEEPTQPVKPPEVAVPGTPADALHAAHLKYTTAQEAVRAAAKVKDTVAVKAGRAVTQSAMDEFLDEFAKADWAKLDAATDKQLLISGFQGLASRDMTKGDGKTAVRALESLVAKLPGSSEASAMEQWMLPGAYMKSGDAPKAIALLERLSNGSDLAVQGGALVQLGDIRCAEGRTDDARTLWTKVGEIAGDGQPKTDPAARAKRDASSRLALVGKAAPEIDSKIWLGGTPAALSAHKGKVVVLDFWATWCPPCRGVMPSLDKIAQKHANDGLAVLGITKFYDRGFLPREGATDLVGDGEGVQGITAEAFPAHLEEFRKRTKIGYPFVTAAAETFTAYQVQGIPTLFVIDRDGKIAFAKVGGGDETLLEMAIERCLKPASK